LKSFSLPEAKFGCFMVTAAGVRLVGGRSFTHITFSA
jgi:hypothetical protein